MKTALVIRHSAIETLARNFTSVLDEAGFSLLPLNIFDLAPSYERFHPPSLREVSFVIVLGGPQSANDGYPAFHQERQLLKDAMEGGTPVFGVCLGAQMMSLALGGDVTASGGYSIGLRKINVTAAGGSDPVFSRISIPLVPTLHGECFSLPRGGVLLADGFMLRRDSVYQRIHMAFRYRNSYGFQFEPQLTLEELRTWTREMADDYRLMGGQFDPEEEAARSLREFTPYAPLYESQMRSLLRGFLENAGLVRGAGAAASAL